jgi:hypothetical protein
MYERSVIVLKNPKLVSSSPPSLFSPSQSSQIFNIMAEFPIEVWSVVIGHLRRPVQPAGAQDVTWKELHQQDLTMMIRVSKVNLKPGNRQHACDCG